MPSSQKVTYLADYKVPEFLIEKIDLTFELDDKQTLVNSRLSIHRNPQSNETPQDIVLNGKNLTLESVALNGTLLKPGQYEVTDSTLKIIGVPNEFTLDIRTQINPKDNTELMGLYKSGDNFCTQCEAEGFREITYFLDRPDVMAVYTTTIIADQNKYPVLLSNGNMIDKGKAPNGKHWITWQDPYKKPSYLYALVAGEFELLEDKYTTTSGKEVSLQIYSEKGYGSRLKHAMSALKKAMKWDEDNYGREYDLDVYKIVAVKDFNMGAMENKGLNIFNARYVLASPESATDDNYFYVETVIGHEYFHNWTGNRITVARWFELSLKEGLTSFREQSFGEDNSSVVARINDVNSLRNNQFGEDAGPLAHSVRPQSYVEIDNFYTSTIYDKGAEIFRMLQTIFGKELFRKGMDTYFHDYDGQAVTIEHFIAAMQKASGQDLSQFTLWFSQAGTPVLDVRDDYNPDTQIYTLKIAQSCLPTPGQPDKQPMTIPVKMGLLNRAGFAIPLILEEGAAPTNETVLLLTKPYEEFNFRNVASKPVPSLLRHFSAPVKLNFNYSEDDLRLLAKFDSDLFNQWDASHRYVMNYLLQLVINYQQQKPIVIADQFIDVFRTLLTSNQNDLTMLATMLTIPSEAEIAELMECIDVAAISHVRNAVVAELANKLRIDLIDTYFKNNIQESNDGEFDANAAGRRYLKNQCLMYLTTLNDSGINKLAQYQFDKARSSNMTDAYAALCALADTDCDERAQTLGEFYQQWKDDPVVITKWFRVQASSTLPKTLPKIKELIKDPAFNIKTPSHVQQLIWPFVNNFSCFHASSGAGYQFLADLILDLDAKNPNISARFAGYFSKWKQYANPQHDLMQQQLQHILQQANISEGLREIVAKSLGEEISLAHDEALTQTSEASIEASTESSMQEATTFAQFVAEEHPLKVSEIKVGEIKMDEIIVDKIQVSGVPGTLFNQAPVPISAIDIPSFTEEYDSSTRAISTWV